MNLQEELNRMHEMMSTCSISEQERKQRFVRGSDNLKNSIILYLNMYVDKTDRTIIAKKNNYGNLKEEWCYDGKETMTAVYYFDNGVFDKGVLSISKELISELQNTFSIRQAYAIYMIEEWYDEVMVPKFEDIVGESGLSMDEVYIKSSTDSCIPVPTLPENITDEEMMKFILDNTAYRESDLQDKMSDPDFDLSDLYLDIVRIVDRKRITGS